MNRPVKIGFKEWRSSTTETGPLGFQQVVAKEKVRTLARDSMLKGFSYKRRQRDGAVVLGGRRVKSAFFKQE